MFWRVIAAITISLLLLVSGCSAARPLHRSKASIRASILKRTPLGTSKKEVEKFIAKEGWRPESDEPPSRIEVRFGGYVIFFGTCDVYGTWQFDRGDRLSDFQVTKSHDVL